MFASAHALLNASTRTEVNQVAGASAAQELLLRRSAVFSVASSGESTMNTVSRSFGGLCLLVSLWACASNCSGANSSPGASGPDSGVGGMDATNGSVGDTGAPGEMNVPDAAGEDGGVGAMDDAATVDGGGVSSPIDLSMWYLELPTGTGTSPTTILASQLAAGFSDEYFYRGADGGGD